MMIWYGEDHERVRKTIDEKRKAEKQLGENKFGYCDGWLEAILCEYDSRLQKKRITKQCNKMKR